MERAKGFEPFVKNSQQIQSQENPQSSNSDYTQIRAQIVGEFSPDLAQVVTAWTKLPPPLKAAILAIVGSVASSTELGP
jgi:hypothetical protein